MNYTSTCITRWRCTDDSCKKSCSIRTGSFFAKSKLSLEQWLVIIHWWVRQYPVSTAAEEAKTSEVTAIQCYQYLRDICSWRLTTVDSPLLLGGAGVVVQIDESLFRHKPKVGFDDSITNVAQLITHTHPNAASPWTTDHF